MPVENEAARQADAGDAIEQNHDSAPSVPDGAGSGDEPLINKNEFVKLAKDYRGTRKTVESLASQMSQLVEILQSQKAPQAKSDDAEEPKQQRVRASDAMSEVQKLRQELAFTNALDESEYSLDGRQKRALKKIWAQDTPDDMEDWLSEQAAVFGLKKKSQAVGSAMQKAIAAVTPEPAKPVAKSDTTDTGAPGADPRVGIPDNILLADPDAWRALEPAEKDRRWKQFMRSRGGEFNPFAARKRR